MKYKFIAVILLFSSYISFAQDNCEELKKENDILKQQLGLSTIPAEITSFNNAYKVKLTSVIGSKDEQTVKITFILSQSDVHKNVCLKLGSNDAKAYDGISKEFLVKKGAISNDYPSSLKSCSKLSTDQPVEAYIIFENILPSTKLLKLVSIKTGFKDFAGRENYNYGNIEMKNLTIDWK